MSATQPSPAPPTGLAYASLRYMMTAVLTGLAADPRGTPEDHEAQRGAVAALLGALHPTDAAQHMFAARTAAAHFTTMECFRRAGLPDQPDPAFARLLRLADGMERMSTRSLDRLKRYQSEAADRRRPATPGLAAAIAQAGRNYAMSSGKAGDQPAPPPAAQPTPPILQAAAAPASAPPPSVTPPQGPASLRPAQHGAPAEHPAPAMSGSRPGSAFVHGSASRPNPEAPALPRENARSNAMPSEPHPGEPRPGEPHPGEPHPGGPHLDPALPFDRQAWLAAVRAMSPQEQHALANRIQALRGESPLA
jgi:hypothetical protein